MSSDMVPELCDGPLLSVSDGLLAPTCVEEPPVPERGGCCRGPFVAAILAGLGLLAGRELLATPSRAKTSTGTGRFIGLAQAKEERQLALGSVPVLGVHDTFERLARGACVDQHGKPVRQSWFPAAVGPDGSSEECESLCASLLHCTGFVTSDEQRCGLLLNSHIRPSDADGAEGDHCFWRHHWLYNTSETTTPEPVPKVIWSFWDQGHGPTLAPLPPFVNVSMESWRVLSPDYEVRVLDMQSWKKWTTREMLPAAFEKMAPAQQADAIRLAVLTRHGGVWLDASGLLLQPLSTVLGPQNTKRPFYVLDRRQQGSHEERVDGRFYVEGSFLAAPPGDKLLERVRSCFFKAFSEVPPGQSFRSLEDMHLFDLRQLEEMRALQIDNGYLTITACFFKSLDEDVGLRNFWNGPLVQQLHAIPGIFPHLVWGNDWSLQLQEWSPRGDMRADELMSGKSLLLKLRSEDRRHFNGLSEDYLVCLAGGLSKVLRHLGLAKGRCGL